MAFVDRLGEALEGNNGGGIILTSIDAVVDWARGRSLWSMPMGTACCAMELIAASFSKFDFDRHGTFPRPDPRHTDVMVVAGTITRKMAPAVKRLYEQMPDPKWVIAMGNCAVSGGIFFYDTYSVVRGVDEFLPVDVYIPGCPPRPEALQDAVLQLRELIKTESIAPGVRRSKPLMLPTSGGASFGARPVEEQPAGGGEEPTPQAPEPPAPDEPREPGEPRPEAARVDLEGGETL